VPLAVFVESLERSLAHRFVTPPHAAAQSSYLDALHVDDLALACACRAGDDEAWEHVIRELRPRLYHAARTIAGDDGRELADSIWAELYGLPGADGERKSLLTYYHGRSTLLTWLRSVLVQRRIDRVRSTRRLVPLDDDERGDVLGTRSHTTEPEDPGRASRVAMAQSAFDGAIDGLEARDRLRLRLYYGQDLTLARIGQLLQEHEATVSRKLERTRRAIRQAVERTLRDRGVGEAGIRACFEDAASAPELQIDRALARVEDG
jgi:RNA polymerase sigma-70 factor (ECF subfamily)